MRVFWQKYWKSIALYAALALLATVFVLVFSISTSPLYSGYYSYGGAIDGGDSLHFQTDALSWLQGRVPYRDFFDHKGPIVYLVNLLGFLLGGGTRYGIIFFQILALTVTLVFVWKISQLAKKSYLWGGISVVITLAFLAVSYNVGNTVQEYNLPFITAALYLMVKYFYQPKLGEHNPKWALVYGIGIGACIMLQITNAILLCVGILTIGIVLLRQKLWQNLWKNCLYGLLGIAIVCVPFVIYLLWNHALGDFIYCTIFFNLDYAHNIGSWLHEANSGFISLLWSTYIPLFALFGAAALALYRKKVAYAAMLLGAFVLELYLLLTGRLFVQYAVVYLCQMVLLLNELYFFKDTTRERTLFLMGMVSLMTLLTYNQLYNRSLAIIDQYNAVRAATNHEPEYMQIIDKHYDDLKATSFSSYGDSEFKGLYAKYKLVSPNRFPLIQRWLGAFAEPVKEAVQKDFQEHQANYILTDEKYARDPELGIGAILDRDYRKIDSSKDKRFILYQLKEAK